MVMWTDLLVSSYTKKSGKLLTNGRHIGKTSRTSGTRVVTVESCGRCVASWAVRSSRAQLRQSYLQRSLNWTGENGGMQFSSQRKELYHANQLTDQTQKGEELAMQ